MFIFENQNERVGIEEPPSNAMRTDLCVRQGISNKQMETQVRLERLSTKVEVEI